MSINEQALEAAASANYIATYPADRTPETWALLKGPWRKSYIDTARAAITAYLSALTVTTGTVVLMTMDKDLGALPDADVIGVRLPNGHALCLGETVRVIGNES